jgi:hypothetical protein
MYESGQPFKATLCIVLTVLVMACVGTLLLMAAARWVAVMAGIGQQTNGRMKAGDST